jgi:GTPase SAR1 family protein
MELEEPPQKNKLYNKILNIRSRIHPIFVPELSALLNKSKKARGALQGKDAVVLLGSSGAGKTTMIQVLLGYPQKLGKDSNGIPTLVPITKLSNEHKEFVAKASSKSVTKYVSAIQINLKKYEYDEIIYLVDTPGFFDSGGVVVDACNSLSTIEVLGTANSIRFGFVFNYKSWGKRADAFKDFVKIISKLFSSYDRNKSKVIYFLNEFTKEEIEGFCARVKEFRKNGLN